jgi:hypothetical protein
MLTTLQFDKFDYVDGDIFIPENTVFFRGVPRDVSVLRNTPLYIATKDIAKEYGENVVAIKTTKELRLIDMRKLKNHIRLVLSSRSVIMNDAMYNCIFYLTIALGMCSYRRQVELFELFLKNNKQDIPVGDYHELVPRIERMKFVFKQLENSRLNPLEPEGVRIAETSIDARVMLILKEIFQERYDGFISPRMFSPFHNNDTTHEEVVIFDPKKSKLVVLEGSYKVDKIIKLQDELKGRYDTIEFSYKKDMKRPMFVKKGGGEVSGSVDRNKFFEDPVYSAVLKNALKDAKVFGAHYGKQKKAPPQQKGRVDFKIKGEPKIPKCMFYDSKSTGRFDHVVDTCDC